VELSQTRPKCVIVYYSIDFRYKLGDTLRIAAEIS
jgi:hypothetical protein